MPEADRLGVPIAASDTGNYNNHSYPSYLHYRDNARTLAGLAGHTLVHAALGRGHEVDDRWGELVTGDYFRALGVRPALGRAFSDEDLKALRSVVVLGHALWKSRFGADPAIVGREVALNGTSFTVVGIAHASFQGSEWPIASDFWAPATSHRVFFPTSREMLEEHGLRWVKLLVRLAPGMSRAAAAAELDTLASQMAAAHPDSYRGLRIRRVVTEQQGRFPPEAHGGIRLGAVLAMLVVALVLMIACANVANLLLARGAARSREIGVRLAIGASRAQLVRQLLTESLILALAGGMAAMVLADWGSALFVRFRPPVAFDLALDYTPDRTVFAYGFVICLAATVVAALVPALSATRPEVLPALRSETPLGARRGRLGGSLVTAQMALSLVVLVAMSLFLQSLAGAQRLDPGFRKQNLLLAHYDLGLLAYAEEDGRRLHRELLERVRALPGVVAASLATDLPLDYDWNSTGPVIAEGQEQAPEGEGLSVLVNRVAPGHFAALGRALLEGRDFDESDGPERPPVAIVNQALARRVFGGESAVGNAFRLGGPSEALIRVVGVARDAKYKTLTEAPIPYLYRPLYQSYRPLVALQVRTVSDPLRVAEPARRELRALEPRLTFHEVRPMSEHMGFALWWTELAAALSGVFGMLALLLSAIGVYGLMAYSVTRRTHEIGIRMALGALPRQILEMVAREGVQLALPGVALGFIGALALARVMQSLLFGVSALDPLTFIAVPLILVGVALSATYLPARRAARSDLLASLRHD